MTKLAPVPFDPAAEAPKFSQFLRKIFHDDTELISFLQRVVGYTLTGDVSEKVCFFLHGEGDNGKSVLLELLMTMLGDYACTIPAEVLMVDPHRNANAPSPEIAKLKDSRLVVASEAEADQFLAQAKLKRLTGRDTITARHNYGDPFEFQPQFKLWLATNHLPKVKGNDKATWNRVIVLPFTVTIPKADQDKHLLDKLRDELPGVLRWAVDGCLAWQRNGLGESATIKSASTGYRKSMDTVGRFIESACMVQKEEMIKTAALYTLYRARTLNTGEAPVTTGEFARAMEQAGYQKKHFRDGDYWLGMRLAGETDRDSCEA
jgi:putative DNA primase/helicase